MHSTKSNALELAPHSACYRLAERSLPDTGRPHEAENRTFHIRLQHPYRKIFQDAFLDLLKIVVIFIQNFRSTFDIKVIFNGYCPGRLINHSIYVRETVYSAADGFMRESRSSSLRADS